MSDYDDEINPGYEPLNSARVAQIVASAPSIPVNTWLLCVHEKGALSPRNIVVHMDPISWLAEALELCHELALVSCFQILASPQEVARIKALVNRQYYVE